MNLDKKIKLINTFSRGWDEMFLISAFEKGYEINPICIAKQKIPDELILKYNIVLQKDMSYAQRDKILIDIAKKSKSLMIAFVRTEYNKHQTGMNTLLTISHFKNMKIKKKDLDSCYLPGFDNDVYLISENPDEIQNNMDQYIDKHYEQIMKIMVEDNYESIVTSGPVNDPIITEFSKLLADKLF